MVSPNRPSINHSHHIVATPSPRASSSNRSGFVQVVVESPFSLPPHPLTPLG
ncbi:hypothetical protein MYCTH_2295788 [Thermothelomyces thermophilus ATCC 42464]|uniref:Uncharacterized protein n=1 Tax=Thermothelomyces thermophilus (strain ATCC 42464 / BCRC 31852 / DSM 1799) TaxID=573729 RepID=G2Q6B2_THET4|nr:uncharacterized protein MYCTH_2295788 [Thermothelomyces thermophilus ATCC 42464]AEO53882.1 hypothetical protein MYCTH_2295788 [Thermothelomyces thermophilus ATCC 42464]